MAMNATMAEAKNSFCQLAARAEAGEVVTVTKHGEPRVKIVPAKSSSMTLDAWIQSGRGGVLNPKGTKEKLTLRGMMERDR